MASTLIQDSLLRAAELRLFEIDRERETAEQQFDDACHALQSHDAFRKRLVVSQDRARVRRAQLLEERAEILKVLGRIK